MERIWHSLYLDGVPKNIELPEMSTYEMLKKTVEKYPDALAFIFKDEQIKYAKFIDKSDRLAASLYKKGVRKGHRIGIMLPNGLEYMISYFAIHKLGAIIVPINVLYTSSELAFPINDAQPKFIICDQDQLEKLNNIESDYEINYIVVTEEESEYLSFSEMIENGDIEIPVEVINVKEDVAIIQYTGGTTGRSKGAMLTHYNLVSNAVQNVKFNRLIENEEIFLGNSPMAHIMGVSYLNISVYLGGTFIILPRFKVDQVLSTLRMYRPTVFIGAPPMYISLLQNEDLRKDDLTSLKICGCGSAPLPIEVMREFEKRSNSIIADAYGMSEMIVTHRNLLGRNRKYGSVGVPLPNTDVKIVDIDTGEIEMDVNVPGELIVKGPQVFKGYWNNIQETTLTLRDGWIYTGDIALMDSMGRFFIVGRKKDLIIASGYNIYPNEIEEVLYAHPAISEVCVYGVPDYYRGETVQASIILKPGERVTEEEIITFCKSKLAPYKVPKVIDFRDSLPKTKVGKILRRQLIKDLKLSK